MIIGSIATSLAVVAICFLADGVALAQGKITELSQLTGKKVAVPRGTMAGSFVQERLPKAKLVYFQDTEACVKGLRAGKVDAVAYDEPVLRNYLRNSTDLAILDEPVRKDTYAVVIDFKRRDLLTFVNQKIGELTQDGTFKKMDAYWFPTKGDLPGMPGSLWDEKAEKELALATFPHVIPFSFKDKDAVVGFDIEFAGRLAAGLGAKLVIKEEISFEQMLVSVATGKADIGAACITVTPERGRLVRFSKPYYVGGIAVMVRK